MALTASDLIVEAAELYGDVAYDRIAATTWIRYLNSALRSLILVRPDSNAETTAVQLAAGVKQTLPTTVLRLINISRNMGTDGLTAGKIVTPTDRQNLDYANLLWPVDTAATSIDNYSYDKETPDIFYVTPPVSSTVNVYVEMSFSKLPETITATVDAIGVRDVFYQPLLSFMLWKAYSGDSEQDEFQKGIMHMQAFFNLLQIEMTAAVAAGPEVRE